jgi:hypothetical protein
MSSKLTLSIAVALAVSAFGGVARANTIPTSTDEARAMYGQVTSKESIDHTAQANVQVTSTDDARAVAGNSVPAPIGPEFQSLLARDEGEGRGAPFAVDQQAGENQAVAVTPAGSGMVEQGN